MKLPRFKLRTLFVLIAMAAIPLGWVANWIHQRQNGKKWLHAHDAWGKASFKIEQRPSLPWILKFLGEEPIPNPLLVGPNANDLGNLSAYKKEVARMENLFPEGQIIDTGIEVEDRTKPITN